MPEDTGAGSQLSPAQLTEHLAALVHGPYDDLDTAGAAGLAAEAVRYLNYAAPRGGVTVPATVATVTADLAATVYRLPQLLTALGEWLTAEAAAGRVGDDHCRSPDDLIALIRAAFSQAGDHADRLADTLSAARNLASTLHAARPAAPAA
jgi:hypothetical protein